MRGRRDTLCFGCMGWYQMGMGMEVLIFLSIYRSIYHLLRCLNVFSVFCKVDREGGYPHTSPMRNVHFHHNFSSAGTNYIYIGIRSITASTNYIYLRCGGRNCIFIAAEARWRRWCGASACGWVDKRRLQRGLWWGGVGKLGRGG